MDPTGHMDADIDPDGLQRHELAGTVWWHAARPSPASLETVGREFDLPAAVRDLVGAAPSRPQRIRSGDWRIWVLAPITFRPGAVQVATGHLVVATDGLVVVTCGDAPDVAGEHLVARVARRHAGRPAGAAGVIDALLTEVLDSAAEVVDELDAAVEDIEDAVFAPQRGSHAERIYRLKREVHRARRCIGPLPDLLTAELDPDLAAGTAALHAKALRLLEQIVHDDALLDSVLSAHQAQVTIQQNDDMRRISAWVAIVAAPTAIASIYGMNFRHMPELDAPLGYPVVLLVMLLVCATLYRLFRRSGWL